MSSTQDIPPVPLKKHTLFGLLRAYQLSIWLLIALTILGNALNLTIPKILATAIDSFARGNFSQNTTIFEFLLVGGGIFILGYAQNIVQTYTSERVARDLRRQLIEKISTQEYATIETVTPAKLLTNLTSDVDAVKTFVAQAMAAFISSVVIIIGSSVLLVLINWKLALTVLTIVPILGGTFYVVIKRVRTLFTRSQEAIDWLNRVINESILGASLIRLLNSNQYEYQKFLSASTESRDIGMSILRLFATLIPVITFATNLATLLILLLGGHYVITGSMTIGEFSAFNSYLAILIFPIIIIGFTSNAIAQADASYQRIRTILDIENTTTPGTNIANLRGNVDVEHLTIAYQEKVVLRDISLSARPGSRTAILGPTAAGKTQLLYALIGLIKPTLGHINYDGKDMYLYDQKSLHTQIGFVFQDSILFNLSVRENIAFSNAVHDTDIEKAIDTAELRDFMHLLPEGLDTVVSERGSSLSGGQKQRIMLARALALNPTVLLLDDFTARVDANTERKILANVQKNYPNITLISVTQKIAPIEEYDQILLLMEGELLASGTHTNLMHSCPEYVQIYNSQKSTHNYELQT